jgi:hypothetical protein
MPSFDYVRYAYQTHAHHVRYARYVEAHGLICQECGGRGGHIEPVLDWGQGPWEPCGWCEGTGKTTRWLRGLWLTEKRYANRS